MDMFVTSIITFLLFNLFSSLYTCLQRKLEPRKQHPRRGKKFLLLLLYLVIEQLLHLFVCRYATNIQSVSQVCSRTERRLGVPPKGKWYYISDSYVKDVDESEVLKTQAYLLFYERILSSTST